MCCPLEDFEDDEAAGLRTSASTENNDEDLYSHTVAGSCFSLWEGCCGRESSASGAQTLSAANVEMVTPNPMTRQESGRGRGAAHAVARGVVGDSSGTGSEGLAEGTPVEETVAVAGNASLPRSKEERLLLELTSNQERWYTLLSRVRECLDLARDNG